jgi:hypothetical protein
LQHIKTHLESRGIKRFVSIFCSQLKQNPGKFERVKKDVELDELLEQSVVLLFEDELCEHRHETWALRDGMLHQAANVLFNDGQAVLGGEQTPLLSFVQQKLLRILAEILRLIFFQRHFTHVN